MGSGGLPALIGPPLGWGRAAINSSSDRGANASPDQAAPREARANSQGTVWPRGVMPPLPHHLALAMHCPESRPILSPDGRATRLATRNQGIRRRARPRPASAGRRRSRVLFSGFRLTPFALSRHVPLAVRRLLACALSRGCFEQRTFPLLIHALVARSRAPTSADGGGMAYVELKGLNKSFAG
jgi:hypothetical protein